MQLRDRPDLRPYTVCLKELKEIKRNAEKEPKKKDVSQMSVSFNNNSPSLYLDKSKANSGTENSHLNCHLNVS